jgi:putative solute:sodium symporter small subunit
MAQSGVQKDVGRSVGYWRANVRVQTSLLVVWGIVGLVLAVLLAKPLNNVVVGGFPLGFWVAQQGSIFVFVALIFIYARRMDRVDEEYDVHEEGLGSARRRIQKRAARRGSAGDGGGR